MGEASRPAGGGDPVGGRIGLGHLPVMAGKPAPLRGEAAMPGLNLHEECAFDKVSWLNLSRQIQSLAVFRWEMPKIGADGRETGTVAWVRR